MLMAAAFDADEVGNDDTAWPSMADSPASAFLGVRRSAREKPACGKDRYPEHEGSGGLREGTRHTVDNGEDEQHHAQDGHGGAKAPKITPARQGLHLLSFQMI
jgi:hypothetical protein